jgi:hypothetical protein
MELSMPTPNERNDDVIRIDLTPEQKAQIKEQTGKDAAAVELSVQELEQRIAPSVISDVGGDTNFE